MRAFILVAIALAAGAASADRPQPDPALAEFQSRVHEYITLHRQLETPEMLRKVTPEPGQTIHASAALAEAIIAARPNAKRGDIFTPAVNLMFRARIAEALAGVDIDRYLADLYEGVDFRTLRAAVHQRDPYGLLPAGLPLPLLWKLPLLPHELEYKIIGRDLALWDEHAALVVDFISNAFPEETLATK